VLEPGHARGVEPAPVDRGRLLVDQDHAHEVDHAAARGELQPQLELLRRVLEHARVDHRRTVVQARLAQPRGHHADGQVEVVDQRVLLFAHVRTAPAMALDQVVLDELGQRLADRHAAHRVVAHELQLGRDPLPRAPLAGRDPPPHVKRDLEVHRHRRGAVDCGHRASL
jgi:hypothetical protein